MPLAHGIGGVRDLPVPESFFFTTAAIVLVVSFVLLGVLWRRPLLDRHQEGRALPRALQSVLLSRFLRVLLGLAPSPCSCSRCRPRSSEPRSSS